MIKIKELKPVFTAEQIQAKVKELGEKCLPPAKGPPKNKQKTTPTTEKWPPLKFPPFFSNF